MSGLVLPQTWVGWFALAGVLAFMVVAAVTAWRVRGLEAQVEDRTPPEYRSWANVGTRIVHDRYGLGTIRHRSTMGGAYVRFDDGTTAHCPLADLDPVSPADEDAIRVTRARLDAMRAAAMTAPLPLHCTPGARCRRHYVRCGLPGVPPCCPTCPSTAHERTNR